MHPVVQQLISLQKVDNRVASVQKKIDVIPRETAKRRAELDKLIGKRDELQGGIDSADERNRELELKVQGLDAAIARQELHRDQSSNASTFTAAQHQIEYLKQDKEVLQNEQIEIMDKVETLTPQRDDFVAKITEAQKEFDEYEAEAKKLMAELEAERDVIAVEREEFLSEIPEGSLEMYRGLFRQWNGQAVVPQEGGFCSGCYTKLTPNDKARLMARKTLVACNACGRILYDLG